MTAWLNSLKPGDEVMIVTNCSIVPEFDVVTNVTEKRIYTQRMDRVFRKSNGAQVPKYWGGKIMEPTLAGRLSAQKDVFLQRLRRLEVSDIYHVDAEGLQRIKEIIWPVKGR